MDCRQGFLEGSSSSNDSPELLAHGSFDFLLLASSWDKRCLCVTKSRDLRATHGALLLFDTRDDLGLRDDHDPRLTHFLRETVDSPSVIHGDSTDTATVWSRLSEQVLTVARKYQRPLRIFIDLSTCPRYLSIGLAAEGLKSGIASEVTFFYAEGNYPEEESEEDQHELFTTGTWDSIEIPGLHGVWDPEKRRAYVVSIGFEGSKTLRLVSREGPDDVSVLFPDPGVKPEYVDRTARKNATLLKAFSVPDERIIRAAAGDAIAAWRALSVSTVDVPDEQNVYYVCCGTKPHSLALGLRAMVEDYPTVLYIVPDCHRVANTDPLGVFWRYDVRNVTALTGT